MKLAPLIGIEIAAFLLIIAETYAFFAFIVPLGPVPHNFSDYTTYAALKVILTFGLGVLWLVVMVGLTRLYVRSRIDVRPPKPSS